MVAVGGGAFLWGEKFSRRVQAQWSVLGHFNQPHFDAVERMRAAHGR